MQLMFQNVHFPKINKMTWNLFQNPLNPLVQRNCLDMECAKMYCKFYCSIFFFIANILNKIQVGFPHTTEFIAFHERVNQNEVRVGTKTKNLRTQQTKRKLISIIYSHANKKGASYSQSIICYT